MDSKQHLIVVIFTVLCIVTLPEPGFSTNTSSISPQESSVTFNNAMAVVLGLIVFYLVLFVWEPIRLDLISLSIPLCLMLLEPWTLIGRGEALSGFSNTATITVLLLCILSDGIRRTGAIQLLGDFLSKYFTGSETRQISMVSGLSGSVAGFLNNTSVVAIFIPMVSRLARKAKTSPSKLMIPLSYASMLGGTLTLIGTSTNIIASEISDNLLNHPFSMFEFTHLGIVIFVVGFLYLVTVGRYLVPDRIDVEDEITEEYEMANFLSEVVVEQESPVVGRHPSDLVDRGDLDFEVVRLIRDEEQFMEPMDVQGIEPEDRLIIRADRETLMKLLEIDGLHFLSEEEVTEERLEEPIKGQKLIEAVITQGSFVEGETLRDVNFVDRYNATVLAIRRGEELTHREMEDLQLQAGDVLLLLSTERTKERLRKNPNFILARELDASDFRRSLMPVALGIMTCVIASVSIGLAGIIEAALAGVIGMVLTGCMQPNEIYDAIDWEIIFLLAGLIPLGISMQKTETAKWLAHRIIQYGGDLFPVVVLLGLFYFMTAVLTNIISNNASVVLMIPVAVDAAQKIGADPFLFVLAVTFAASTAFMTPVGYQTNLMVMGPGGYKFRDFMFVGAPLQILLTILTPIGIVLFW